MTTFASTSACTRLVSVCLAALAGALFARFDLSDELDVVRRDHDAASTVCELADQFGEPSFR